MLIVDQQIKELGNLKFGEPFNFDFKVTNNSDDLVVITKLVKSCSACTEASINKNVLPPKDSATLSVVFTPGVTGDHKKEIQILHTLGRKPSQNLKVTFKAKVHD